MLVLTLTSAYYLNIYYKPTVVYFRFMWPCIINVGEERTNGWHK